MAGILIYSQETSGRQSQIFARVFGSTESDGEWPTCFARSTVCPNSPRSCTAMFNLIASRAKRNAREIGRLMDVWVPGFNPRYEQTMQELSAENQRMMVVNSTSIAAEKQLGG